MLSEKAYQILTALLQNAKPLSVKDLSELLEISERCVCSYLEEVKTFCNMHKAEYICKRGDGITVVSPTNEEMLLKLVQKEKTKYTADYRKWYIANILLKSSTPYTMALFANELNISKETVSKNIDDVKDWLSGYNLKVVMKRGLGIQTVGDESDIRGALVESQRNYSADTTEKDSRKEVLNDYRIDKEWYAQLTLNYKPATIRNIVQIIGRYEKQREKVLSKENLQMVVEHILVQNYRCLQGLRCVTPKSDFFPECSVSDLAKDLSNALLSADIIPSDSEEIRYLYYLLFASGLETYPCIEKSANERIKDFADKVLKYVSVFIDTSCCDSKELYDMLVPFLYSSIIRVAFGFQLPNPLLKQTKKEYPSIFSACYVLGKYYEQIIGKRPAETEISHLAMLVGGYIQSGITKMSAVLLTAEERGITQLIALKFKKNFPNLNIVKILPYSRADEIDMLNPNIVISTMRDFTCRFPTLYVMKDMIIDDMQKLQTEYDNLYRRSFEESTTLFQQLLRQDLIFLDRKISTRDKVIRFASDALRKKGCVDENFYDLTIKRELLSATAIGNGIAIPHCTFGAVKKPAVCMVRLDKSINWGGEPVDIVFALALDFVKVQSASVFFKVLYSIMSDKKTLDRIRKANTVQGVLEIIKHCY